MTIIGKFKQDVFFPDDGRLLRPDPWERGGEIPPRHQTPHLNFELNSV